MPRRARRATCGSPRSRNATPNTRIADADTRHRELERENARLTQPVSAPVSAPAPVVVTPPRQPVAASTARPAYARGEQRGWFDWGDRVLP